MDIAILPDAYRKLMEVALAALPAEAFGALIGRSGEDGEAWGIVEEVAPVTLIPVQAGLAPDVQQWQALQARLAERGEGESGQQIVGWFYTDSAIGIFKPRINVVQVADMLGKSGSLLLIVNPVAQQGGFYVKLGERFAPVSGFHEVLVDERAEPVIPWTGDVQGVQEWLGASYTTYTYSTENIEHYDIPEGMPRRASRFATAKPAEATPEEHGASGGEGSDQVASAAAGIEAGPSDEPASTMKWDADAPATLAAYRRAGPVTALLPALENNAAVEARPAGTAVGVGEGQAGGRRLGLPGTRIALGVGLAAIVIIVLIWGLLGSNGRKAESNAQLAAGTATPMLVEGAAQTATARSALVTALPSATAVVPTQTPRVSATTTAPPTATPKVDTPTPTASPTSTATVTATSTAAATTYVVQPGDTLTYIARSYGTTAEAIMEANGMSTTVLTVGQVLIIP